MSKLGGNYDAFRTNTGHYTESNRPKGLEDSKIGNSLTAKDVSVSTGGKVEFSETAGIKSLKDVKTEIGEGKNKPAKDENNTLQKLKDFFAGILNFISEKFASMTAKSETTAKPETTTGSDGKTTAPSSTSGNSAAKKTMLEAAYADYKEHGDKNITSFTKDQIGIAKATAKKLEENEAKTAQARNREPGPTPTWQEVFKGNILEAMMKSKENFGDTLVMFKNMKASMDISNFDTSTDPDLKDAFNAVKEMDTKFTTKDTLYAYAKEGIKNYVSDQAALKEPFRNNVQGSTVQSGVIHFGAEKFQTKINDYLVDNMPKSKDEYFTPNDKGGVDLKSTTQLREDVNFKKDTYDLTKDLLKDVLDGSTKEKATELTKMLDPGLREYALEGLKEIDKQYKDLDTPKLSQSEVKDAWKGSVLFLRNINAAITTRIDEISKDNTLTPNEKNYQRAVLTEVSRTLQTMTADVTEGVFEKTKLPKDKKDEFIGLANGLKDTMNNMFEAMASLSTGSTVTGETTDVVDDVKTDTPKTEAKKDEPKIDTSIKLTLEETSDSEDVSSVDKEVKYDPFVRAEEIRDEISSLNVDILELEQSVNGDIRQFEQVVLEHYNKLIEQREELREELKTIE